MADQFLTTRWSVVLAAGGDASGSENGIKALEAVCQTYWRPLFAYARRWGLGQEDAEDAVQGFLASVLRSEAIRRVSPEQGRFRTWLLNGMKNHLIEEQARATAIKRGGPGRSLIPLDTTDSEGVCEQALASSETPDRVFDRAWALTILAQAKRRLQEECEDSGKRMVYDAVFLPSGEGPVEDYGWLADRLGLTESGVRSIVHRLRLRWRDLIRAEIAETVSSREALEEELACLKTALTQ